MSSWGSVGPSEIVEFWREAGSERWFKKNPEFDRTIAERFGSVHAEAAAGRLQDWASTPGGALALILVLDQFSRNLYRGSRQAFAQDEMAAAVARRAVDAGLDRDIVPELRSFFYLPFMHSEAIADQERCVLALHTVDPKNLSYAREHERIIRRFGRFPHRNPILGRSMTPAEQRFIDGGGFAG